MTSCCVPKASYRMWRIGSKLRTENCRPRGIFSPSDSMEQIASRRAPVKPRRTSSGMNTSIARVSPVVLPAPGWTAPAVPSKPESRQHICLWRRGNGTSRIFRSCSTQWVRETAISLRLASRTGGRRAGSFRRYASSAGPILLHSSSATTPTGWSLRLILKIIVRRRGNPSRFRENSVPERRSCSVM